MKAGIGTASMHVGGLTVGAIMVVNSFGDVIDPQTGQIIAGARSIDHGPLKLGDADYFGNTLEIMKTFMGRTALGFATKSNTVIGVIATNAKLTKPEATKVAQMAQDGLARTIRPAHTMLDGMQSLRWQLARKKLIHLRSARLRQMWWRRPSSVQCKGQARQEAC